MNKKLLIFGIAGWGYAGLVVVHNLKMRKELVKQAEIIEEAVNIVTEGKFREIIENEGLS
jgi:hypothetical protein